MSDARRATLFALGKVEFMNVNYNANGAFKALGWRGIGPRRRHHRCRGIVGVLRFSGDPIPNRRTGRLPSSVIRQTTINDISCRICMLRPRQREPTGTRTFRALLARFLRVFRVSERNSDHRGGERERESPFSLSLIRHFEAHVSI